MSAAPMANNEVCNIEVVEKERKRLKEYIKERNESMKSMNVCKTYPVAKKTMQSKSSNLLYLYFADRIGFVDNHKPYENVMQRIDRKAEMVIEKKKESSYTFNNIHTNECISIKEYLRKYLVFSQIIDLSESDCTIKTFNMDVLKNVLIYEYIDDQIICFVKKITIDAANYINEERKQFYYILFLSYFYVLKIFPKDRDTEIIRQKLYARLKQTHFLFDTSVINKYYTHVEPTGNIFIDKQIIRLFATNSDKSETHIKICNFMHFYYSSYLRKDKIDADIFYYFQKKLNNIIGSLHLDEYVDCIRKVFLKGTVFYTTMDKEQVVKFLFLFYKNKMASKTTKKTVHLIFDLFYILSANHTLVHVILDEIMLFLDNEIFTESKDEKILSAIKYYQIRTYSSFGDFFCYVIHNCESFNSIKLLVDHLINIHTYFDIDYARFVYVIEFLDLIVQKVKLELINNIYMSLVDCLKHMFSSLNAFLEDKIKNIQKNIDQLGNALLSQIDSNVEKTSNFVNKFIKIYFKLFAHAEHQHKKKKKKAGYIKEDTKDKKILNLMSAIRDNESIVCSYFHQLGIDKKYTLLKDKGIGF